MLIHDRFIFIHVPKTGGVFLRDVLQRELPPGSVREEPDTHAGWEAVPAELRGRPMLAYVRNPWDWYVSGYHYMMKNHSTAPPRDPLEARIVSAIYGEYTYDFPQMVRTACSGEFGLGEDEVEEMMDRGSPVVKLLLEGCDLYTACFLGLMGREPFGPHVTIGRYESLVDDLERFLNRAGVELSEGAFSRVRAAEPLNATAHRHYREYYDDSLRNQVGEACSLIRQRFDYSF